MQIDNLLTPPGADDYYNESFRNTLEALLPTFRQDPALATTSIVPNYYAVYRGDFFGLLLALNVSPCYHWFTMRLNGLFSPFDFDESLEYVILPSTSKLEAARQTWKTTQVISV